MTGVDGHRGVTGAGGHRGGRVLGGRLAMAVLVAVTLPLLPLQMLARRRGWRLAATLPVWWHRFALTRLDVRVRQIGRPAAGRPLLLVGNHVSWLDIPVFGSLLPVSFVAKSDVAAWPVFGLLARLQGSVFVDRTRRQETATAAAAIAARILSGDAVLLFAEGTTSDGNRVLPFRSALIGAAKAALPADGGDTVMVQPVAIAYVAHHGIPLGRHHRPLVAWPGTVALLPHLAEVFRRGAVDVDVVWGDPVAVDAGTDRKRLAARLEAEVAAMVRARLSGRHDAS